MIRVFCCYALALPVYFAPGYPPAWGYVTPMIGGGQIGMAAAAMKHIDVTFDGGTLHAHVDGTVATPRLRPLTPPDQFDPAAPWGILEGKAYNFQYGWNAGGFITLPAGAGIWVEHLLSSPDLEVFSRPPANPAWTPILGTEGSSSRWKWSGAMTHNVYAVLDPRRSEYRAEYRIYLGDAVTGAELDGYGDDLVTLIFVADAVLLPGDLDGDGMLTAADIDLLTTALISGMSGPELDLNHDDIVSFQDHDFWVKTLKRSWLGDSNLDGEFNSRDFVQVFQSGRYEAEEPAGWAEGDWTSDRRFGSSDLVAAFQDGGYEVGPRPSVAAIPEPSAVHLLTAGVILLGTGLRHGSRCAVFSHCIARLRACDKH